MVRTVLLLLLCCLVSAVALADGPTLAVADFDNHTGDASLDPAGPGVAAVLVSKLSRLDAVRVVERARLQELLAEVELGASGVVDPATAAQAGRVVGADYMVLGSIVSARLPAVGMSVRVVDTSTGSVLVGEEVVGEVGQRGEEFFVLVDELCFRVVDALEIRLAARDRIELGQVDVRELQTVSVFGEALGALDQGQSDEAQRLLGRALAREPGFRLAEEALQALAAEVDARQTAYAHAAIEGVHELWDRIDAMVAVQGEPEPTMDTVARWAIQARLHLIRGELEPYLDLETRRAELTTLHYRDVAADARYPASRFESVVIDLIEPTGSREVRRYFRHLAFWPYDIRAQVAEIRLRLGQREEAVALLLDNYQHPGPPWSSTEGPGHPLDRLQRWGAWDEVVVLREQQLRQAELGGNDERVRKALDSLEEAIRMAELAREGRAEVEAVAARLAREPASRDLLLDERRAVRAIARQDHLATVGYRAFLLRVDEGYYAEVANSEPREWKELATAWHELVDGKWGEAWFVERRLAHLLAWQGQVPPGDDEQVERYREHLESFIDGGYKR